nr:cyclin-D4-1-like [Tanacetum cinerariifolium]
IAIKARCGTKRMEILEKLNATNTKRLEKSSIGKENAMQQTTTRTPAAKKRVSLAEILNCTMQQRNAMETARNSDLLQTPTLNGHVQNLNTCSQHIFTPRADLLRNRTPLCHTSTWYLEMTPSVDLVVSSLLCAEENDSICYFDDDVDGFVDDYEHKNKNENLLKDQNILLVARQQAVDWISKVHTHFSFGPLSAYLSVNYLDRFLAVYELPKDKPWMIQLLAVTCLSLGAKMDETKMPLILDMQEAGGSRFVFEAKTIQRMELIVLSTLDWRMKSVTPFSFIDSFIGKINDKSQFLSQSQVSSRSLILKSTQLILGLIKGIDFLEFHPSEIAAAVAIYVVGIEVEKNQISAIFEFAKKERVVKCMQLVTKSCSMSFGSGILRSLPESPIGVLEAAILRYKNDDSPTCAKRRRLNYISL